MTNYPNSLDGYAQIPTWEVEGDEYSVINSLRDATLAIEKELGLTPRGVYSDARARLDILESRINYGVSAIIPNDGYVKSPLYIFNVPSAITLSISDGYGAPTENRVDGSLYLRNDGYVDEGLYSRRGGVWKKITTDPWVAAGDLSGTYLTQTVIGIQGKSLNSSLTTVGSTQDGYHLTWDNADGYWRAETGFVAGSDLAADSVRFGRTGQKVIRIQNSAVSSTPPLDGYVFVWETADNHWEPQARSVMFAGSVISTDGYITRTNLTSNKLLQSPSSVTSKVGMVNLGSRSSGSTTGTTDSYAAILSGDRHTVSGNFGLAAGGDSHTVSGQYAAVVDGYSNTASGSHSAVLDGYSNTASGPRAAIINGNSNLASGSYSTVLDGYSNTASGANSFVLNGGNNQANADFSGVLNGISNIVTLGATHGRIGSGNNNTVAATALYSIILGGNTNTVNGQNNLLGATISSTIGLSNNASILSGNTNTIGASSNFSTILGGQTNSVAASSTWALIGNGNNITVTGLYATVLNATVATANGLHTLVLNGNTNNITGTYSTIVNGLNNTISGNPSYATILDGYQNTITGNRSLIGDGYINTISGFDSSILNGNNNTIASNNATILNGSFNNIDVNSPTNVVLFGTSNILTSSTRVVVAGHGNTFTNVTNSYVLGQNNTVQGESIKITGDSNIIGAGSNFNRIFGNTNNLSGTTVQCSIFGANNNLLNSTHDSLSFGSSNIIDGYGNNIILGMNNVGNSNFGLIFGQYGKTRLYGQQVQSNSRFTVGKVGEAQFSRIILTGTAVSGGAIALQLQDTIPTNATFQDGYSYEMSIRVLIVNTAPISPNPVVPARFVIDVLAHQEGGVLILDNVNQTLTTPQASGLPWTVTIGTSTNQITVTVDAEPGPTYVQPTNTPSNRRAIATVEMREISRL
jgi:hypothetical protein